MAVKMNSCWNCHEWVITFQKRDVGNYLSMCISWNQRGPWCSKLDGDACKLLGFCAFCNKTCNTMLSQYLVKIKMHTFKLTYRWNMLCFTYNVFMGNYTVLNVHLVRYVINTIPHNVVPITHPGCLKWAQTAYLKLNISLCDKYYTNPT